MIFNVTGGGGNAGLNFSVVSYETQEEMLSATPAENTIGIITETPITKLVFSVVEPSIVDGGTVWIHIGTNSRAKFNALKKNGIQVYPIGAKQYIGGEWVNKTAQSYQGGVWVDFIPEDALYWNGHQCLNITGGWEQNSATKCYGIANTGTVTFDDAIYLSSTSKSQSAIATTKNAIDFTNYTTLIVMIDKYVPGSSGSGMISIHNTSPENVTTDSTPLKTAFTTAGEFMVDISGITGYKYLSVSVYHIVNATISHIRWE